MSAVDKRFAVSCGCTLMSGDKLMTCLLLCSVFETRFRAGFCCASKSAPPIVACVQHLALTLILNPNPNPSPNPQANGTYAALAALLAELVDVFPDRYLHLGGDEVPFDCWRVRDVPYVRPSMWIYDSFAMRAWALSSILAGVMAASSNVRCQCQFMRDHTEAARTKPTAADSRGIIV